MASQKATTEFLERRLARRVAVDLDVDFSTEVQTLRGTTCDVSEGGVCIAAYAVVPNRTPLQVRLVLPRGRIAASAEVRWVKPSPKGVLGRLGIVWLTLSDLDRRLLTGFLHDAAFSIRPPRHSAEIAIGDAPTIPPSGFPVVPKPDPVVIHERRGDRTSRTLRLKRDDE